MKIIHCADLHLDSRMSAHLDGEKRKKRRAELLATFDRLLDYAVESGVYAVLIAGDLFDTPVISKTARAAVLDGIRSCPDVAFYYLKGNHDSDNFLEGEEVPDNLYTFNDSWTSYALGDTDSVILSGIELTESNCKSAAAALIPDINKINIVMLHGQESRTGSDMADQIPIRDYQNKGIDYMALGHIHARKEAKLDARGVYVYPGALEGRGFDECGEKGFMLLDIDEEAGTIKREFVPFASRILREVHVDITGATSSPEALKKVEEAISELKIPETSLVKVTLEGEMDAECEFDLEYILNRLEGRFFYVKVKDGTGIRVNYDDYALDRSLKGEFVRKVMASELSSEDKAAIIRYGIQAIAGEEIS